MVDMRVRIGGIELKNPVMPGSGTMGEGLARVMDLNRIGAIVTKTITPDKREGCVPPRMRSRDSSSICCARRSARTCRSTGGR